MDMSQFREMFVEETREHLRHLGDGILALEKGEGAEGVIDSLFRSAHSIKGMAASMEFGCISELAHGMEDLMDRVRKGKIPFGSGVADLLLEGADIIGGMVDDIASGRESDREISDISLRLASYGEVPQPEAGPAVEPPPAPSPPVGGEAVTGCVSKGSGGEAPRDVQEGLRTVRVRAEILDRLVNVTGELITTKNRVAALGRELESERLGEAAGELARLVRELHDEVMSVRMMPFASISERFPRMVRDLAKRGGKEIAFEMEGGETELDRGILEALSDPLVHILRNAADHGIEPPAERQAAGKGAAGNVRLSVRREKDLVVVAVEDDGKGMDPDRLVRAAVDRGLVNAEVGKAMTAQEAFMLTCLPGFSTAGAVTDLSGRGVGMDAVQAAARGLGGTLAIESEKGRGSRVILRLPSTIAIVKVLLVVCAGCTVAVPVSAIGRTVELERRQILSEGKRRFFRLDRAAVPLVSLNRMLGFPPGRPANGVYPVIVAEVRGRTTGLVVDRFLGQSEVFAKPLGRPLAKLKGLSAGTILGDGEVVFILDLPHLQ